MSAYDPEIIARVLEGRATPEERARLLKAADESPELLALLADAAAVMNATDTAGSVVAMESRRLKPMPRAMWIGIAAVLVAAVTIPAVWRSGSGVPAIPLDVLEGPRVIAPARAGTGASTVRGGGDGADMRGLSVLLGRRVVDYIALAADTSRATVGLEIAAALRTTPGGSAAASGFESGAAPAASMIEAVEQIADRALFRAAAWAEVVRLSAVTQDPSGIQNARAAFGAIAGNEELSSQARATAGRIRDLLAAPGLDWVALERESRQLFADLALAK